jgi:hypothetical protein
VEEVAVVRGIRGELLVERLWIDEGPHPQRHEEDADAGRDEPGEHPHGY